MDVPYCYSCKVRVLEVSKHDILHNVVFVSKKFQFEFAIVCLLCRSCHHFQSGVCIQVCMSVSSRCFFNFDLIVSPNL